jgi:NADPH-dependent glutamate synthase beta subunit-like oxidoreductase/NAD-dependent dihydropyrimidine dehydrogenase PreA subunit
MSSLEHVDDYPEIPISLASTTTALKTGSWRSVRPIRTERSAPCSAGCPAGIAIPAYLHDITAGRLTEAFHRFSERNPFPRITGRVCPHTCQDECNLAITTTDGAVSIRSIERWLGDATAGVPYLIPHPPTGMRVAVVGSGPAGLAAAHYLRRSGHDVTVFERRNDVGGMLRHAIPSYRLPSDIVDTEIARLVEMGIEFRAGVDLGSDVDLDSLETEYAAVFVATGAGVERPLGIPGDELTRSGLGFLDDARQGAVTLPGPDCVVIGGGNTAMDVARVARRLGASVEVLYRRTETEMPAIREEFLRAQADGVTFTWLSLPTEIKQTRAGLLVTVEEMRLGAPDETGRPRPEPTGTTRTVRCDAVFTAIGETADLTVVPERLLDADGWLSVEADGVTPDPAVFAGGDLVSGPSTVIAAIVAGREAARAIDTRLGYGQRWPDQPSASVVGADEANPATRIRRSPAVDPEPTTPDLHTEETDTIDAAAALDEVERCLSCGHCNECGTCFVFCPDAAIAWEEGPVIDLEYCKGCGICVTECPGGALVLVNERDLIDA